MENRVRQRLTREDWVRVAFEFLQERGAEGVKIVVMADRLGVTSGSFYWHFKDLRELRDCLLEYWEADLTDAIIDKAMGFSGSPEERILDLMLQVIEHDAAAPDHAVWVWSRSDPAARKVFERTLRKRFDFARWMFKQTGLSERQATIRGRLLVAYLMGEFSTGLKTNKKWRGVVREAFKVLTSPVA